MPCHETQPEEINSSTYGKGHCELRDTIKKLEACLCAVFTELEARGTINEITKIATDRSGMDVELFWATHSDSDQAKMTLMLNRLSVHEQNIMRKLLK